MTEPSDDLIPEWTIQATHGGDQYLQAINLICASVQIWDADGKLLVANPASEQMFGHGLANHQAHNLIYANCLHENGGALRNEDLPVNRILKTAAPINNLLLMLRSADDKTRWLRLDGRPIRIAPEGASGAIITATDITDFIEHKQHLEHLASYDPLTQLPNRLLLAERIRISLARARRMNEMVAVCMLDLDGFKAVNDSLGHHAGDELLREVALRLREAIRGDDTVARMGGDEFAVLLCSINKVAECEQTLSRILSRLGQPYQIAGQPVRIGASAGIALFPNDDIEPDMLLHHADVALYQAKEGGKNRFHFFDRKLDMRLQANRGLLRKIGSAAKENQFTLHYQPIVNCRTGQVEGVEALIRWRHPVLGMLAPSEFLPLIEQDDLGITVGEWVIDEILCQLDAWDNLGIPLDASINLASRHLQDPNFINSLRERLVSRPSRIAGRLHLEIAESAVMADVGPVAETLRRCHDLGLNTSLDNFGVGYASLQHLKRLPIQTLKIDQSFVHHMLETPEDMAIVAGVVGFATPFGCKVIGTGAETIEHVLTLLEVGCEVIQGFGVARPMSADKLIDWLRAFQPDPLWRLASLPRPTRDHFELLLAEANHRAWVANMIRQVRQAPMPDQHVDDHHCRFGIWLNKPSTRHLAKFEEFERIVRLHHLIHLLADEISSDYQTGNLANAQAREEDLLEQHGRLLALLKSLRGKLAGHPLPPSAFALEPTR